MIDLFSVLRDFKRILRTSDVGNLNRRALLATYLDLHWRLSKSREVNVTKILDYSVHYLDASMLKALYRDIFISQVYGPTLNTEEPLILDCGSNIGMSILFFKSRYPSARVFGFEPHPRLYQILEDNVRNNDLKNVRIFRKALSDHVGTLDFFVNDGDNPGSLNMGLIQREKTARRISVEADLLSNYISDQEVDLLKLDVEGAEEQVLRDLQTHNKLKSIRQIVCEFHHHIDVGVDRLSLVLRVLEDAGFGYQLSAYSDIPPRDGSYQDVMVYAFNKAMSRPGAIERS